MAEHIVGETSDISEGAGKTFTIEGQTIAVFNKGEGFFAIEDTCKHKGESSMASKWSIENSANIVLPTMQRTGNCVSVQFAFAQRPSFVFASIFNGKKTLRPC